MAHNVAVTVAAAVAAAAAAVVVAIVESHRGWLELLCYYCLGDLWFHWGCSWRSKIYEVCAQPAQRKIRIHTSVSTHQQRHHDVCELNHLICTTEHVQRSFWLRIRHNDQACPEGCDCISASHYPATC